MFALAHDISERKQAEDALGEKEKLLAQIVIFAEELLKTGSDQVTYPKILENLIYLSKAKYGVLTLLNESTGKFTTVAVAGMKDSLKKVSKMIGVELVGKEWNDYSIENEKLKGQIVSHFSSMSELTGSVVPEIIVKTIEKLIDMGEVTVTKVIVNNKMIGDYTLIMPAGKHFENDALIEIYSRQIDMFITRIKAEDQLNASEEKYRTVADFTYDWEAWRAPDGTYLYVSPSCERISGHMAAEFIADPNLIVEITHPDDKAAVIAHFHESGNGSRKQDLSLDFRIITAKGEIRWINHCCTAVFGESGLWLGRRESNRDITERKQAEQALLEAHDLLEQRVQERTTELSAANLDLEKAARMKDEFLAAMSHELRTPLTGILGLSEVMQMPHIGSLNEKQSSYLTNIHKSGQRLLVIINDMLDYSMIESGKVNLSLNPCSLEEICQSSLQLIESLAAAKGLQSNLSVIPENILLNADARRLQKILVNLLGNAVKFTPKGGSFGIEALGDRTAGQVQITVWDSGIGIKEEDLPRLFQPFIQLDARLARQYEGTGLGLAMVRRLTELHGGSVTVQSVVGQGSRFTVCLPWQPASVSWSNPGILWDEVI
jgi:PAS domain S-box-containing protein